MKKHSNKLALSALFLCMALVLFSGCSGSSPKNAVKKELELIQNLDEATIKSLISYKDMVHTSLAEEQAGEEAAQAIKLFFKNFSYKIKSSKINKNHAAVVVEIKNIDTNALAKDLCKALIAQSASLENESKEVSGLTNYFTLLHDFLSKNSYELVTDTATVSLTQSGDSGWTINASDRLEDELVGGFVSRLKDSYLINPEETLAIYMDSFKELSPEEWVGYLGAEDVFSTGNALYPQIDLALAAQLTQYFDYHINSSSIDGSNATVNIDITSLDLDSILKHYTDMLLQYAGTTEAVRASDSELSNKTSEYLLTAIKDNKQTITKNMDIKLVNDGSSWVPHLDKAFSDALLGDISAAIESFNKAKAAK